MNNKLGLADRVTLSHGNVLNLKSLDVDEYDHAYMMHVGMNIKDKRILFQEASSKMRRVQNLGSTISCISIVRQN